MKFDVIIGNPPYLKNTHLDFLDKSIDLADMVLMIHPSGWLFRRSSKKEKQLISKCDGRIESVEIFNGNFVFVDAEFATPLSITKIADKSTNGLTLKFRESKNSYHIENMEDFPTGIWEPTDGQLSLIEKYKSLTKESSIADLLVRKDSFDTTIDLGVPEICAHVNRYHPDAKNPYLEDDFWLFFYRNSNLDKKNSNNKCFTVSNRQERESLRTFMMTKVARYGLSINKITIHNHINRYLKNVPLPPLDREWNEKAAYEYYNFSEEEINVIEDLIPDYY